MNYVFFGWHIWSFAFSTWVIWLCETLFTIVKNKRKVNWISGLFWILLFSPLNLVQSWPFAEGGQLFCTGSLSFFFFFFCLLAGALVCQCLSNWASKKSQGSISLQRIIVKVMVHCPLQVGITDVSDFGAKQI